MSIQGRLKDVSAFEAALNRLVELVEVSNDAPTQNAIDGLADDLDEISDAKDPANVKINEIVLKGF